MVNGEVAFAVGKTTNATRKYRNWEPTNALLRRMRNYDTWLRRTNNTQLELALKPSLCPDRVFLVRKKARTPSL